MVGPFRLVGDTAAATHARTQPKNRTEDPQMSIDALAKMPDALFVWLSSLDSTHAPSLLTDAQT